MTKHVMVSVMSALVQHAVVVQCVYNTCTIQECNTHAQVD